MSGCFDHLNLSAANLFMPSIDAAIATARRRIARAPARSPSAFERWCVDERRAAAHAFRAPKRVADTGQAGRRGSGRLSPMAGRACNA
jgi:hypothetical protein